MVMIMLPLRAKIMGILIILAGLLPLLKNYLGGYIPSFIGDFIPAANIVYSALIIILGIILIIWVK